MYTNQYPNQFYLQSLYPNHSNEMTNQMYQPTRSKYMKHEFCLEQRINSGIVDNRTYVQKRTAWNNAIPCAGINVGYMPNTVLSNNAIDVESDLLQGTHTLNCASMKPMIKPQINKLPKVAFFERMNVFIPEPLVIEKGQRPIRP